MYNFNGCIPLTMEESMEEAFAATVYLSSTRKSKNIKMKLTAVTLPEWNIRPNRSTVNEVEDQLVQEPARYINHGYRYKEGLWAAQVPQCPAPSSETVSGTSQAAAADLASTSTTGIPILMDGTNEQTIDISIGSATELRDVNISRSEAMQNHWRSADERFKTVFEANPFGLSCSVCDRLWFERDLKKVKHRNISFLQTKFPDENVTEFRLCSTCSESIDANKIPTLSLKRFRYPPSRADCRLTVSIRLISRTVAKSS
ncbi:hypothetical protein EVAR_66714_1 [Eumeta japonica]|uniref:Uncharacterized protein n=1 Tax=Eumeta variegata TaxID=151549 RepID=A0A4C1ZRQ8_EUMVA|nr:hypothetical protein EVAR_66714_1 [Eumeta japonica]